MTCWVHAIDTSKLTCKTEDCSRTSQHLPKVLIMSSMVRKPQLPMRVMYARLVGSEAPVALLYSTRARGSSAWSALTAMPVSDGSAHVKQASS